MTYAICKAFLDDRIGKISENLGVPQDETFLRYCYSLLFDKSIDDIDEEDIIEGSSEKQIDIINIEDEDDLTKITIVQCKNESGFSSNSFIGLKNGLGWILEKPKEEYSLIQNFNLVNKINEIRRLFGEKNIRNISLEIFFITKGNTDYISDEFNQELNGIKKWEEGGFRDFKVKVWGAKEIVKHINLLESLEKVINQRISIIYDLNNPSVIKTTIGDYKGLICSVKAEEIARIIDADSEGIIFNKNIRKFLGGRRKINKSIYDSCTKEKEGKLFWFLNNGITMVCDDFELVPEPDNPHIKSENLQIVNGCQTSKTLHNAFIESKLNKDTSLLVRLYATGKNDQDFLDKITLSTNNQNKISARDLKSNDDLQQGIQKIFLEKYGHNYERKVNEFIDKKTKNKIGNEKVAQAFLSFGKKMPSTARSQPNVIWGNEEFYEMVFRKSNPAQLFFCYKLYEFCNNLKREKIKKYGESKDEISYGTAAYGTFHLVRIMGFLYLKSESFPHSGKLDEIIKELSKSPKILQQHYDLAFKMLVEILKLNKDKYETPTNFYKSKEIHSLINNKLKKILDSP